MKMRAFRAGTPAPAPNVELALDQRQIVQAALALLDEAGFDGLTMRNLASRLGIKAASLYWHVRNKQELLGLLAEEICAPIRDPDPTLSWFDQLVAVGNQYRQVLLAHRDAARVLSGSGAPSTPNRLRLAEIMLRTLLDAGFSRKDAAYAGFLLTDFVTAFVLEETLYAHSDHASSTEGSSGASAGAENWLEALPPDDYPSLLALSNYLIEPDLDERFQFGIDILRKGLEARLASSKAVDQ
jgi:TetR/AcrR family tetracycline transcriptional repressor